MLTQLILGSIPPDVPKGIAQYYWPSGTTDNRHATPLFDTELFVTHIEAAYTVMYERYQADLPLDHIYVPQQRLHS